MLRNLQFLFLATVGFFGIYQGMVLGYFMDIWWWDIPIHFASGAWAGMFFAWFFFHWNNKLTIFECAMAALVVGLAWEVFEHLVGLGGSVYFSYWPDTIKDLIMDTLGGILSGVIVRRAGV